MRPRRYQGIRWAVLSGLLDVKGDRGWIRFVSLKSLTPCETFDLFRESKPGADGQPL
jgi:hypothetical protein